MTWRVPPYDRALDEAEAYIRASWQSHGIVVSGSIVRGEAGPTSDLDIVVVHREPWRLRDQRRFAGVPAELFVNPPERIRGYFAAEHGEGRPCTAHMLSTGEVLAGDDVVAALIAEARDWLARPLAPTPAELIARRYAAVDTLDDARDVLASDTAAAHLLLASAVQHVIEYAFWQRAMFQPRRKHLVPALAAIDAVAADHVRAFAAATSAVSAADIASALARHVLGADTFFAWTSERS